MRGRGAVESTRWLAVDLGNSVECPGCRGTDAFATPREAERWIRRKVPLERVVIRPKELPGLRLFRDRLRDVLAAAADRNAPLRASMTAVNWAATRSPPHLELRWRRGRWRAVTRGGEPTAAGVLTSLAARSLIDLLTDPSPVPLRRCAGPGCVHFLLARRPSQRWCSATGCGNRARVQRHYRRVRSRRSSKRLEKS